MVLGGCTIWLLAHNYINDVSLERCARLQAILDAPQLRFENLGLVYPHLPFYLLMPFFFVPGLSPVLAPYLTTIVVGAGLLVIWQHHLAGQGYSAWFRAGLLIAVVAHPYFLWAVTAGTVQDALSLVLFYAFYRTLTLLAGERDIRSFIVLALILATYFFVDERAVFLFIALLPLLPLVAPRRMIRESPLSVYAVVTFPFLASVASWAYLNWIFSNDPWLFWNSPESSFRGGWFRAPDVEWLRLYGGMWLKPILVSVGYALIAFPAFVWLLARVRRDRPLFAASAVLFLHPLIAIGFGTMKYFITHPMAMLFLFSSGLMAGMSLLPALDRRGRRGALAVLLFGVIGGWYSLNWAPDPEIRQWRDAFVGEQLVPRHQGDIALGQWLRNHRQATLMDENGGFRVIVARGDAKSLMLSFSDEFKMALKRQVPNVEQIAIPDPAGVNATGDRIDREYPLLYSRGMENFALVYDGGGWRVYRRKEM